MVGKQKKAVSIVLAVLMLVTMLSVGFSGMISASAASGDMVYFEAPSGWSTPHVYCWGGTSGAAGAWPGTAMTKVSDTDNVYSYTLPGDQVNIIFNNGNGSHQTSDQTIPGANQIFKVTGGTTGTSVSGAWSAYDGPVGPTNPVDPTDPPATGDTAYAYLANTANWTSVNVYYWSEAGGSGSAWPGKTLTDADKDMLGNYQVAIPANQAYGVIFSQGGNSQSADLMISPGQSMIYDNSDNSWKEYDTSAVKVISFGSESASPQYKGTDIVITADAQSNEGTVSYKFSVKSGTNTTVLSDYSTSTKSVIWTPTTTGNYQVILDVKDTAGNENQKILNYVINDDATAVEPVLKGVTPTTGGKIAINTSATVNVNATGGKTGTNLLFYKIAIEDPSGNAVNTVYYKTSNKLIFTPNKLGTYTVDVSVQNSDNTTVTKSYTYECVGSVPTESDVEVLSLTSNKTSVEVDSSVTFTAQGTKGTSPYTYQFAINGNVYQNYSSSNTYSWTPANAGTYSVTVTVKDSTGATASKSMNITVTQTSSEVLKGDIDMNGVVSVNDTLLLQKHIANIVVLNADQLMRARIITTSGDPSTADVLQISKYLANIIAEL